MQTGNYTPDPSGLAQIGNSAGLQAACEAAAEAGAAYARSAAPQGEWSVEPRVVDAGWHNDARRGAALVNNSVRALLDARQLAALEATPGIIESA